MGCFPLVPRGLVGVLIRGSQAFARGLRGLPGFFVSSMGGLGVLHNLLPSPPLLVRFASAANPRGFTAAAREQFGPTLLTRPPC